jgi:hypothetical protein
LRERRHSIPTRFVFLPLFTSHNHSIMPAVRRSETAPRKSSRVSQLDSAKQQREQAKEQQLEKERKAEAAAERKAKAAKGKGKKKSGAAAAAKRKPAQKRKSAAADEDGEGEEEEKEVKKPRKAPTARGGAKEDAKDVEEENEDATGEEAEADEPAKVEGGKYKIGDVVEDVTLVNGAFYLPLTDCAEIMETRWKRRRGVEAVLLTKNNGK